jgi:hypothetical protein
MKCSKREVRGSTSSIPDVRFEEQSLTSFSGLVLFQRFFQVIGLKDRLRLCVRHIDSTASYRPEAILLLLVVHLVLGWRRLRDLDYYRDDPLVLRTLGLRRLPNVSTLTRTLRAFDHNVIERLRRLMRNLVIETVAMFQLARITLDFDGTVISTKSRSTEGTAVGFNPKSKGNRSYYPLVCTLAQTGQVFDLLHRAGNVHDSIGAGDFITSCIQNVRDGGFRGVLEARFDSAHFSDETCRLLDDQKVEFSVTVPFERFPNLKSIVEERRRWHRIDSKWSFFEVTWKPISWRQHFRCFVFRQKVRVPRKGPIQLQLFEPVHHDYEYKVVMTNKTASANAVLAFHNGRGSQEASFGELKSNLPLDYIPTRRQVGNQVYALACCLAHNLCRQLQISVAAPRRANAPTRAALWVIDRVASFRKRLVQRAGRLTNPAGKLTLTLGGNRATAHEYLTYLDALRQAA